MIFQIAGGGFSLSDTIFLLILIVLVIVLVIILVVRPKIKKIRYTNKQIYKAKGEIVNFELTMRNFIRAKLEEKYGDEWWEKGIPEYIRLSFDDKIRKEQIEDPQMNHQNMEFLEINHYFSIILEKKNWENVFSDIFPHKSSLGEIFENLRSFKSDLSQKNVTSEELSNYPAYIYSIMTFFSKGFNIFMSYSTMDSAYFQIPEISKRLESYPKIDKVFIWEVDSGENIVKYMERTLRISRIFVFFCTERSLKSKAVTDEWEAAFQLRKKGLMKIIPVYEYEKDIPYLLMPLLNVKFTKENFDEFVENLYQEIIRGLKSKELET